MECEHKRFMAKYGDEIEMYIKCQDCEVQWKVRVAEFVKEKDQFVKDFLEKVVEREKNANL